MKGLKLMCVIIVYLIYLPYLFVMLFFEMLKNLFEETIIYFENTNI